MERVNLREHVTWCQEPGNEDTQMLAEDYLRMGIVKAEKSEIPEPFIAEELPEILSLDYRRLINRSRDMDLFYYLLKPNTRSLAYYRPFDISKEFGQEFALYAFYLKTAPFDIPLRIELFQSIHREQFDLIKEIGDISGAILPISQYNKNYGIPAPIVEADARAKIKEAEVEALFQLIRVRHPTPDLWLYRRERAPWKF